MDTTQLAEHLTTALDALLAALVVAGGVGQEHVPDDALDAALNAASAVQDARRGVQRVLQQLRDSGGVADALLDLEEATNALAARCAEAGFRLGRAAR